LKEAIYPERESKTLEFKESAPRKNQIIKTCVAFANGAGGELVIGVSDKMRVVVGIDNEERESIFEEINNLIFDSISPSLVPEIYEKNIDDKIVVIIKVYPGNNPPYFIKGEGSKKGVYLRVGSSSRRATGEYIEELHRNKRKTYFDEELSGKKLNEIDSLLLEKLYGEQYSLNTILADKVVIRDSINPETINVTNAGILFFSERPDLHIPEALIICTQFRGRSGRDITQTTELNGPIPILANSALKLLLNWMERDLTVHTTGEMKGNQPIPLKALREAIVNALVHRKYFIPGAIKIALYDDHIEIFSPGDFPGLVSTSNLGDGTTFLRNPTIARLARKSKLVEKLGSGIRLIIDECEKWNLKKPEFNEDGDFVKVTFYFEKQMDHNLSEEDQIIQLGFNLKELRIKDLIDSMKISRNTATRKMNALIEKGYFERKGKGPGTYFIFRGELDEQN